MLYLIPATRRNVLHFKILRFQEEALLKEAMNRPSLTVSTGSDVEIFNVTSMPRNNSKRPMLPLPQRMAAMSSDPAGYSFPSAAVRQNRPGQNRISSMPHQSWLVENGNSLVSSVRHVGSDSSLLSPHRPIDVVFSDTLKQEADFKSRISGTSMGDHFTDFIRQRRREIRRTLPMPEPTVTTSSDPAQHSITFTVSRQYIPSGRVRKRSTSPVVLLDLGICAHSNIVACFMCRQAARKQRSDYQELRRVSAFFGFVDLETLTNTRRTLTEDHPNLMPSSKAP